MVSFIDEHRAQFGVESILILPSDSGHWFKRSFGLQMPLG